MKSKTILAMLIVTAGLMIVIWQSIAWTTLEKVVDLGPVEITAATKHSVPLLPILGGMALGIGTFMLVSDRRQTL